MEESRHAAMASLQNTNLPAMSAQQTEPTESATPSHTAPTWTPQWNSTDASQLAPANLAVSKVQHAWERRPQSPFTRRRLKVGKVWKRGPAPSSSSSSSSTPSMFGFGATIRAESPQRAVKKMRGAMGEQVVRGWDVRGSPTRERRIITRSSLGKAEEGLVELGEEGAEVAGDVEEEVLRVEIEHEDGTILELDAEEGEAEVENENWDDESMTEEVVWDATLMHLGETVAPAESHQQAGTEQSQEKDLHGQDDEKGAEQSGAPATPPRDAITSTEHPETESLHAQRATPAKQVVEVPPVPLKSALRRTSQFGPLPEGFVSPVKERRRRTINQVRLSNANRRRTLPVSFAAQNAVVLTVPVETVVSEDAVVPESVNELEDIVVDGAQEKPSPVVSKTGELILIPAGVSEAAIEAALADEESDIELGLLPDNDKTAQMGANVDGTHDENVWEDVDEAEPAEHGGHDEEDVQQPEVDAIAEVVPSSEEQQAVHEESIIQEAAALSKLDLEPVENIIDSRPPLSLRRSPRRQSTSPVRQSGILPSSSRSHLVAFTPIKLPIYTSSVELQDSPLPTHDSMDIENDSDNPTPLPQPTRSSSAPPEEPQMSPRRPKQPRISDDTALLQAFLNRAAESKTSKDSSVTAKRESMENRRDSTSVRQALASPAPLRAKTVVGDVLMDLDPNSPSPRKQALAAAETARTNGKTMDQDQDEDELALNATPTKPTPSRKSGRVRKTVSQQTTLPASTYSRPNRISIRGNADSVVVLKKTEAQEVTLITRNNTRKNKSGAVLPPIRLTRLAAEKLAKAGDEIAPVDDEDDDEMADVEMPMKTGKRAVKWAETLESFHEGANEPEMSMLSDELGGKEEGDEVPAASDTPSNPARLRRLRTPRPTAASRNEKEAAAPAVPETKTVEPAPKPRATKRSSRIATPAKLPGAAKSLLPDGLDDEQEPPAPKTIPTSAPATKRSTAPATRRKVASSKLPAPSAPAASLAAASGKENSLIASPPKKRSITTATGTKGVPKLDFSSAGKILEPSVPGIAASPAKKGNGRANVLFKEDGGVTVSRREEVPPLGMGSPAKKRSRR